MASKLELMLEAERRGILPADKRELLFEARKRGLIEGMSPQEREVREKGPTDYTGGLGQTFSQITNQVMDPFGVRDEMIGAFGSKGFLGKFISSGGDLSDAAQGYSDEAERVRAEQRIAREENTILPEIAGGVVTALPAKGFQAAKTLGGRILQSAKAGAGYGAVAGATHSEGGIPNRLLGAVEGAATGAVLGPVLSEAVAPAIGGIVRTAKAGGRGLSDAVRYVRGRNANADARMARALEDQNMSPAQGLRRLDEVDEAARFGKTQLDPRFTLADLGPSTRDLVDTAGLVSRQARTEAGNLLNERTRGQYGRTNDYLRRSMKVTRGDFAKTQAKLVDEQRTLSRDAYRQAYDDPAEFDVGQVLFDRQFDDFAAAGPLRRALNRARNLFVEPSRGPGLQARLNTERFDSGKRALDDMIESAMRAGRNNEARLLTQLKNDLVSVADNANPAYQTARDVYGSRAQLLEALDDGRAFMKGDAEFTGAQYRSLTTGERRMFRIGVVREVRKALGRKGLSQDAIGMFDKPNVREVLEEIMTPAQARKFYDLIDVEQALAATNTAVRGNSATARRQQNILDFSFGVRLGRAIRNQGLREAVANEISDQITKFFAMREGDALAVTRAMMSTDRAAQRATLNRLAQVYGKTNMRGIVNRTERLARRRLANERRKLAGVAGIEEEPFRKEIFGDSF